MCTAEQKTWKCPKKTPSDPPGLLHATMTEVGQHGIFLFGGQGKRLSNAVYKCDPGTLAWSTVDTAGVRGCDSPSCLSPANTSANIHLLVQSSSVEDTAPLRLLCFQWIRSCRWWCASCTEVSYACRMRPAAGRATQPCGTLQTLLSSLGASASLRCSMKSLSCPCRAAFGRASSAWAMCPPCATATARS